MENHWIDQIELPALITFDSVENANFASKQLKASGLVTKEPHFSPFYRQAPYCIYIGAPGVWWWTAMSYFDDEPDTQYAKAAMAANRYSFEEIYWCCQDRNNGVDVFGLFDQLFKE